MPLAGDRIGDPLGDAEEHENGIAALLGAVLFSIISMLAFNHLPRLNHPLFDVDSFRLASTDKFFLVVLSNDPKFDQHHTRAFLNSLDPVRVDQVGQTEEPE